MKSGQTGRLWTRNFTVITLGTLVSAIGSAAMGLALTLVVFDQTASTWLSGVYGAVSILPGVTLPFFLAPAVDRHNRKHIIVGLDTASGVLYLLFLAYIRRAGFQYAAYLLFSLVMGCIGAVYSLAYESLYPDLIPTGMEQKGYAVSSMIYPLTTTLVTPVAAVIYKAWGVEMIFLAEGCLLLVAAAFEAGIVWRPAPVAPAPRETGRLRAYGHELLEGVRYLKRERGIRSIYGYMAVTNAASNGNYLMVMAHFQSMPGLGAARYSLLVSAETVGRALGAAVHYVFRIPEARRYWLTVRVYAIYELFDGVLLFVAWPVMLVLRFLCGFLGVNTATLREAAVQRYLPQELRARVNGLFDVLLSAACVLIQLAVGALGELLPYRFVTLGFAVLTLGCMLWLIAGRRRSVEPIYNFHVEQNP